MEEYKLQRKDKFFICFGALVGIMAVSIANLTMGLFLSSLTMSITGIVFALIGFIFVYLERRNGKTKF